MRIKSSPHDQSAHNQKLFARVIFLLALLVQAASIHAASIAKAEALYQNNLIPQAKEEVINIIYDRGANNDEKAKALYLLGVINKAEGKDSLARQNFNELKQRFPKSPEAQLVDDNHSAPSNNSTTTHATPNNPTPSDVQLIREGVQPNFLLRYYPTKEPLRETIETSSVLLDHDCPTKPAKTKYNSVNTISDLEITLSLDKNSGLLFGLMKNYLTVTTLVPNKSTEKKSSSNTFKMTRFGKITDSNARDINVLGSLHIEFPLSPIGVGATWTAPFSINFGVNSVKGTAKYKIKNISEVTAVIEGEYNISGQFANNDGSTAVSGGGSINSIWKKGEVFSKGTTGAFFIRFDHTDTNGKPDVVCALIAARVM